MFFNHRGHRAILREHGEYQVLNSLTQQIIGIAMKVHSSLGPGLLESAYKECLVYELRENGLSVQQEVPIPLIYKEVKLECGVVIERI
jgi:GxxExxY protein